MYGSFDPTEIILLERIIALAATDLGIEDEGQKSLMALRVVAAAEQGERDFDLLMTAAKGDYPHKA